LEAYVRTIKWLNLALWGKLPQPLLSEFQAAEPLKAAIDQLAPRFKGRNVAITVADKGGWMCGDDEWIRTAVLGVLNHAAESVQGGTIGVRLNRVDSTGRTTEERIAIEVLDAGPLLTNAQRADLERPFGSMDSPSFLDPNASGFIPGLVLAAQLARQMGGLMEFDATPAGGLIVRLLVPARVPAAVMSEPAMEPTDVGPLEELVMGWRLGVA
jgi:signal transduction histidine kinase